MARDDATPVRTMPQQPTAAPIPTASVTAGRMLLL